VIGYIGIGFHTEIANAELGTAILKSYSGDFLLPTPESVAAAAASLGPRTPADEPSRSLTHRVPIRWSTTNTRSFQPSRQIRKLPKRSSDSSSGPSAIATDETNEKYLEDAHFIPLAAHIWVLSHDQIEMIK
jgi:phosphate transport system substrate-binding protein